MANSGISYFQDKMTMTVLRFKYSNVNSVELDDVLELISSGSITPETGIDPDSALQIKNVCAKLSVQLSDRIDNVCKALSIPKRSFIELAIINALSEIDVLMEKHGVSDCFTESVRVGEVALSGKGA